MSNFLSRRDVLGLTAGLPLATALPAEANDRLPLWAAAQRSGILFGASAAWRVQHVGEVLSLASQGLRNKKRFGLWMVKAGWMELNKL